MLIEYQTPDGRVWRQAVLLSVLRSVEAAVVEHLRDMIMSHNRRPLRMIVTPRESHLLRDEHPGLFYNSDVDRFIVIPVVIEEDPQDRFLRQLGAGLPDEILLSESYIEAARVWARALTDWDAAGERLRVSQDAVDAIYRRHGGSQTPPSQRPPSRLHPLVLQDEADRKAVAESE